MTRTERLEAIGDNLIAYIEMIAATPENMTLNSEHLKTLAEALECVENVRWTEYMFSQAGVESGEGGKI